MPPSLLTPPPPARLASLACAAALAACAATAPAPSTPSPATPPAPPLAASAPVEPAPAAVVAARSSATGLEDAARQQAFADWLGRLRATARNAGLAEATLRALDGARYLPRVVELDRAQPEFSRAVWDYLDTAVSPQRILLGQDKLAQVRREADAAEARYGVPATIVAAIWGLESNYGSNFGSTPTIDALATLGFEGRREAWAREQLLAALKILQSGDITRERMLGSWAGAMGQTQFLPGNFLAYAVDADGDGRRDIWGSMADVTASTANFLARAGWQAGVPWGLEVRLPPGFDPARADDKLRQRSAQWAAEGVQAMDAAPLPEMADASLLLPAGARGPAFLVGGNFRAILRYNNATSYALAVGLLAQQLAGGPGVQAAWPRDLVALSRSQVLALQTALNQRGFDTGTPDGVVGPATRDGLRRYQRSLGQPADGYPTLALLAQLRGETAVTPAAGQTP